MKRFSKFLAIVLSIAITIPMLALSAGAIDSLTVEEPQIISDTLQAVMEANTEETTRVAVWLKDIETEEALSTNSMPSYAERLAAVTAAEANSDAPNEEILSMELKRTAFNICYEAYTENVSSNMFEDYEIVYSSRYLPLVIAELSDERIEQIAMSDLVESIDYQNSEYAAEATQASTAYVFDTIEENIQYINAGTLRSLMPTNTYVKIGIIDTDNPEYRSVFAGKTIIEHHPNGAEGYHVAHVAEVIMTVAPYASYYISDVSSSGSLQTEVEWLLDNGVHVTNMSYGVTSENKRNIYENDAKYVDMISCLYGMTFVKSAGNYGAGGVTPPAMGYNVITVGNFSTHSETIAPDSSYSSNTELPFKPDISAPGTHQFSTGASTSGTSFAAPVITGIVAVMMSYRTECLYNYRLNKAILVSSTLDDFSYLMGDSNYRQYGAGVVDGAKVRQVIQNYNAFNGISAEEYEWRSHYITLSEGDNIRISLVYDKVNTETTLYDLATLGMIIMPPSGEGSDMAVQLYSNVAVTEFTASETGTYEVRVLTYIGSGSTDYESMPYYAVAWYKS